MFGRNFAPAFDAIFAQLAPIICAFPDKECDGFIDFGFIVKMLQSAENNTVLSWRCGQLRIPFSIECHTFDMQIT